MNKSSGAVSNSPRIVLFDIETSHNLIAKFDLRDEWVPHTNILRERFVICAAWKALGEKSTHAVAVTRKQALAGDDKQVIQTVHRVLSEADVVVGHNANRFDIPWLNGRVLFHRFKPMPPLRVVDTLTVAKRSFSLNSNRLDYLGKYLGLGGKTSTPAGLWLDVLKGDSKAIRTMVEYNKRDVTLLEDVFMHLRPYVPDYINRQFFGSIEGCPRCGSTHIQSRGLHRSLTQTYNRFQCCECGGWFRSRVANKAGKTSTRVLP